MPAASVAHPSLSYTFEIGHDNSVVAMSRDGDFEVRIDIEDIVRFLGPSARRSKSKKATASFGAVVVKSLEAK